MSPLDATYRAHWIKLIKRLETSFFYYDLDWLTEHLKYLDSHKDPDIKFWYACKANPLSSILKIFRNLNFGVDIASLGELEQALSVGLKSSDILATGPCKSKKYLHSLLKNEVEVVVLESLNQALWLNQVSQEMNQKTKVLLRVQLSFDGGHSVLGGNSITPFGVTPDEWQTLNFNELKNLDVIGLHAFQWGNILDLEQLKNIWWKTTTECLELADKMNFKLQVLDLGGGLGVPYEAHQKALDFEAVAALLGDLKTKFKLPSIWMELGRYAVAECGYYLSQIADRKQTRGLDLLVLEGGINHIARPALTNQAFPAHPLRVTDKPFSSSTTRFQVHGPLCTALDKLGQFDLPSDLDVGDWVVFSKAGAYGFTEAMPFFLCHPLPAEVIQFKGDVVTPRTPKTSTDWLV